MTSSPQVVGGPTLACHRPLLHAAPANPPCGAAAGPQPRSWALCTALPLRVPCWVECLPAAHAPPAPAVPAVQACSPSSSAARWACWRYTTAPPSCSSRCACWAGCPWFCAVRGASCAGTPCTDLPTLFQSKDLLQHSLRRAPHASPNFPLQSAEEAASPPGTQKSDQGAMSPAPPGPEMLRTGSAAHMPPRPASGLSTHPAGAHEVIQAPRLPAPCL